MNLRRTPALALLTLVAVSALGAETIAIAVRPQSDQERAPLLVNLVEQGAMDHLFGSGHIVFDIEVDPADEISLYRSINEAQLGGAGWVVVLDVEFIGSQDDDLFPGTVDVTVVDAATESEVAQHTLVADELDGRDRMSPDTVADRLGDWAARVALADIAGGDAGW